MGDSSTTLHEDRSDLSEEVVDRHRAIVSLMEELEAVDWYSQRAEATHDEELKAVLLHNRNEEIEHASMVLEWLRRRMPVLDEELRTYLFKKGSITELEGQETDGGASTEEAGSSGDGSLGIGNLR